MGNFIKDAMKRYLTHLHIRIDPRTKERLIELAGGAKNISAYVRDLINREWLASHPDGEPSHSDPDAPCAGTA